MVSPMPTKTTRSLLRKFTYRERKMPAKNLTTDGDVIETNESFHSIEDLGDMPSRMPKDIKKRHHSKLKDALET